MKIPAFGAKISYFLTTLYNSTKGQQHARQDF